MADPAVPLDDYAKQAVALNFIVAFQKSGDDVKFQFARNVVHQVFAGVDGYSAIASVASSTYGIAVDPDVLRRYVHLIRTPAPGTAISAFMKRVIVEPALRAQFLGAATSYDALAKIAAANGVVVTPLDLQNYIGPWATFVSLLAGLLAKKTITESQFETYAGFASGDSSLSGFGQDVDMDMMRGILSAASWATKGTELSSLSMPVGVVVFPATAIIMGGLTGQRFSWGDVGNMFENSFSDALEATSESVQNFGSNVSSIFS